jgi:hypothetical protein
MRVRAVNRWRSSPRFRRRTLWATGLVAAAGGVAAVALGSENAPDFPRQHLTDRPAQVERVPRIARLTKADTARVVATSTRFVRTAVAHRQLRAAYDLVGPELRGGLGREEWARGDNPVVPFPAVGIAGLGVAYSYRDDVALDLALVAKPGSDTVGKTFRIELRRRGAAAPWRVVSWLPLGVSGSGNVRSAAAEQARAAQAAARTGPALAAWWLAFPLALLSLGLLLPVGLGVRSWRAGRRAERAYRDSLGRPSEL